MSQEEAVLGEVTPPPTLANHRLASHIIRTSAVESIYFFFFSVLLPLSFLPHIPLPSAHVLD